MRRSKTNSKTPPVILSLTQHSDRIPAAAEWFSDKWNIPVSAYLDSMTDALTSRDGVPAWFIAVEKEEIVGGIGIIGNDFHDRPDLAPNVCAVYVCPESRGMGLAGRLLDTVCAHAGEHGIRTLYLVTDHVGFYERYGWQYLYPVNTSDGLSRMYCKQTENP